jgi:release factor glutamine methyltransferase
VTDHVVERLRAAGCVAAEEEAGELRAVASDEIHLDSLVRRREAGEPLAWITGRVLFCGVSVAVDAGVYVPRWQTEVLTERAVALLPEGGIAVDLCCGSGAISRVLAARRPAATIVATDIDPSAVACAGTNGVDAHAGDLFAPLARGLRGTVDVVVAVPPYVPSAGLAMLARTPEPPLALDGGPDGLDVARRIVSGAPEWLRRGGSLLIEIGRPQVHAMHAALEANGFRDVAALHDLEGDVSGLSARFQEGV